MEPEAQRGQDDEIIYLFEALPGLPETAGPSCRSASREDRKRNVRDQGKSVEVIEKRTRKLSVEEVRENLTLWLTRDDPHHHTDRRQAAAVRYATKNPSRSQAKI